MTQAVIQTTVTGMQGRPIATTVPVANQAYTWSGTAWVPTGPFLPLAGGVLTGVLRYQYGTPSNVFNDTTQSITAGGLWREYVANGNFVIQSNSATAGDFSTAPTPLSLGATGNVNVGSSLSVGGNITVSGGVTANGNITGGNLVTPGAISIGGATLVTNAVSIPGGAYVSSSGGGAGWSLVTGGGTYNLLCQNAVDPAMQFSRAGAGILMSVTSAGSMSIAGTLSQGSDATNKTNINPLTQGISLVRQLLPKSYQRTTPTDAPVQWGFVAQDVETVIPEAVIASEMGEGGTTLLGLDVTAILAAVTFAVKQLDQRCTALEAHDGINPPTGALA